MVEKSRGQERFKRQEMGKSPKFPHLFTALPQSCPLNLKQNKAGKDHAAEAAD